MINVAVKEVGFALYSNFLQTLQSVWPHTWMILPMWGRPLSMTFTNNGGIASTGSLWGWTPSTSHHSPTRRKKPDTSYIVERCNEKGGGRHMHAHARKDRHFITPHSHMVTCDNAGTFHQNREIRNTRGHKKEAAAMYGRMLNYLERQLAQDTTINQIHCVGLPCMYSSIAACYYNLKF